MNAALCPRAPPRGPDTVNNSGNQNELNGTSATQSHCETAWGQEEVGISVAGRTLLLRSIN